jgi:carboxyl-terminal processing protease
MISLAALVFPLMQAAPQTPTWVPGVTPALKSAYTMSGTGSATDSAGAVVHISSSTAPAAAFVSMSTTIPADSFRARRIRVSVEIDARDAAGAGAYPWVRIDGPAGQLAIDNAADAAIKGTNAGRVERTIYVPASATQLIVGMRVGGPGTVAARRLRIEALPRADANAPLAPRAKLVLDSAFRVVRNRSLWRDTVTWVEVEPEFRAIAAGATTSAEVYPAIRFLLARLGDRHSFLMLPTASRAFTSGGAANPKPQVREQAPGIGYVSIPAYGGAERTAMVAYVQNLQDSLSAIVPKARCGWIVDLRGNGGGNMWPMLGGLRPLLGEAGLGSFVSPAGSSPLWHARDAVDIKPTGELAALDSAPVAVLVGPRTVSSGEAVTISFIGRPRTRLFGLPTAGLSTSNTVIPMPDSSMVVLTVSVEADRNGKRYGEKIEPDEVIPAAPVGSTSDPQLDRAVAWLRAMPKCSP